MLMVNFTRRLLPIVFSGLLLVPLASTVAAEDIPRPRPTRPPCCRTASTWST